MPAGWNRLRLEVVGRVRQRRANRQGVDVHREGVELPKPAVMPRSAQHLVIGHVVVVDDHRVGKLGFVRLEQKGIRAPATSRCQNTNGH